jgi:outer membrane receptor protein involved in Fe transport
MQKSTQRFCNGEVMRFWNTFLLCFLLTGIPVALTAQSYQSLNDKVSINLERTNAVAVVKSLEQQTSYTFAYDPEYLQRCELASVKFNAQSLSAVLKYLDDYAPIDISYANNTVALKQGKQQKVAGDDKGRVTGKILDNKNEPLPGVTVKASNGQGTVTGVDGTYQLSLDPGTYILTYSFVSYDTRRITEVVVKEKEEIPLNVVLKPSSSQLQEVVVTGNYKRASVEGLYALQKNNASITDGISSEQISRTPDKNIGEVLKRVSGLSTMENKYVVVRGLSERYNQAVLNNQVMPSTELNRKNFSFDVVPSNIVENVVVVKTITADRSAEFGGGLVEVNTLDIPVSRFFDISVGSSINDKTTGKPFLSLQRENREFFGKAASHRELLGSLNWKNTTDVTNKFNAAGKEPSLFSNNWGLFQYNAPVSQNYQISGGNVYKGRGTNQFGFVGSLSYRNTYATQDIRMSRDGFQGREDTPAADYAGYKGKRYGFTTNLGGLIGFGFRNSRNRVGFQSLYLRTLDESLIIGSGSAAAGGIQLGYYDLTTQTAMWQNQLKGEHAIGKHGARFKWMGSYLTMDRQKPDNHQITTPFIKSDSSSLNGYEVLSAQSNAISSGALRWWSRALEKNFNWEASLAVPFAFKLGKVNFNSTAKTGYAGWNKDRLFYVLNVGSTFDNHNGYYQPLATAFSSQNNVGFYFNRFGDDFHRSATLHAMFGQVDTKIGDKFRLVLGLRGEYYNLNKVNAALDSLFSYINQSRGGEEKYDYTELKNREPNWNWFPSVNLTYSLTPAMNLRGAFSKSIIRPDLRELSFFREYDFELGGAYESDLIRSTIAHHVDFRYEWYPGAGEIISFSLFYKKFDYSMEIYADEQSGGLYKLRNNKKAENYGLEVEVRKSLAFTKTPVLKNITLYGNFTALDAYVTPMLVNYNALDPNNPLKVTPVEALGKREKRPQSGASNYIVNAGIFYDVKPASFSLVYNYITNRMFRPDMAYKNSLFERPLETLDGQIAVRFLKGKGEIKLNVSNILNRASLVYQNRYTDPEISDNKKDPSTKELMYKSGQDVINYEARPGRTYSTTISYKF